MVTEEWPPYNYTKDGKVAGCSTAVVRAVLQRAGIDFTLESYAWARAYAVAQALPGVLIYSIARDASRETLFHWVGPMGERRLSLYRLAGRDDIRVRGLHDLHEYQIGLVRGDIAHQYFESHGFADKTCFTLTPTMEQALRMLLAGRLDVVPATEAVMVAFLRQENLPLDSVAPVWQLPMNTDYYMALSLGTEQELVRRVQEAFASLQRSGELEHMNAACFADWGIRPSIRSVP